MSYQPELARYLRATDPDHEVPPEVFLHRVGRALDVAYEMTTLDPVTRIGKLARALRDLDDLLDRSSDPERMSR